VTPRAPRSAPAGELDEAARNAVANAIDAARGRRTRRAAGDALAAPGTPRFSGRRIVRRMAATMRDDAPLATAPSPVKTPAGWRNR
jgi:hypothetical protein